MPKLTVGGVKITRMKKSGCFALAMGSDYGIGEEAELIEKLIEFATKKKSGISALIPDTKAKKMSDGGYSPSFIEEVAQERDTILMVGFNHGFPSPYLAFFVPGSKPKGNRPKQTSEFARKA